MCKKKTIIIVVNIKVFGGNYAASARLRNYSRAIALDDTKVIICEALPNSMINIDDILEVQKNIYEVSQKQIKHKSKGISNNSLLFLKEFYRNVNRLIENKEGESIVLLYPSANSNFELMAFFILKFIKKRKVYYEANEVRKFGLQNTIYSNNILKRIIQKSLIKKKEIQFKLTENITRYYDGIIAISKNIEKYYGKYNNNIIRVPILSDTDIKLFNTYPQYNRSSFFDICFTGSISIKKEGFDMLLDVLHTIKKDGLKVRLHLYGTLDSNTKNILLNKMAKELGIKESIIYHGFIDQENLIAEMQKYHLLILPRPNTLQAKYGFSTKLSEYLVSGIPVLMTDVSDNGLYIKDGINGYIIPPRNKEDMVNKLKYIIENYNKEVAKIVENAYETAQGSFYFGNYTEKFNSFLK